MKLPAELRNRVYELILINDGPIHVRARHFKNIELRNAPVPKRRVRWREPRLLTVSKPIRDEAMAICYERNAFHWYVASSELELVRTWLKRAPAYSGARDYNAGFNLHIKARSWNDIASWLPLARISYEKGQDVPTEEQERYLWNAYVNIDVYTSSRMRMAFGEVFELGRKAAERGTSYECFESDFYDWAIAKMTVKHFPLPDTITKLQVKAGKPRSYW